MPTRNSQEIISTILVSKLVNISILDAYDGNIYNGADFGAIINSSILSNEIEEVSKYDPNISVSVGISGAQYNSGLNLLSFSKEYFPYQDNNIATTDNEYNLGLFTETLSHELQHVLERDGLKSVMASRSSVYSLVNFVEYNSRAEAVANITAAAVDVQLINQQYFAPDKLIYKTFLSYNCLGIVVELENGSNPYLTGSNEIINQIANDSIDPYNLRYNSLLGINNENGFINKVAVVNGNLIPSISEGSTYRSLWLSQSMLNSGYIAPIDYGSQSSVYFFNNVLCQRIKFSINLPKFGNLLSTDIAKTKDINACIVDAATNQINGKGLDGESYVYKGIFFTKTSSTGNLSTDQTVSVNDIANPDVASSITNSQFGFDTQLPEISASSNSNYNSYDFGISSNNDWHIGTWYQEGSAQIGEVLDASSADIYQGGQFIGKDFNNSPIWGIDVNSVASANFSEENTTLNLDGGDNTGNTVDTNQIIVDNNHDGKYGLLGFTPEQIAQAFRGQQVGVQVTDYQSDTGTTTTGDVLTFNDGTKIDVFGNSAATGKTAEYLVADGQSYDSYGILGGDPAAKEILIGSTQSDLFIGGSGSTTMIGTGPKDIYQIGAGQTDVITSVSDVGTISLADQAPTVTDDLILAGTDTVSGGTGRDVVTALGSAKVSIQGGSGSLTVLNDGGSVAISGASGAVSLTNLAKSNIGLIKDYTDYSGTTSLNYSSNQEFSIVGSNGINNIHIGLGGGFIRWNASAATPAVGRDFIYGGNGLQSFVTANNATLPLTFIGGSSRNDVVASLGGNSLLYAGTANGSNLAGTAGGDQLFAGAGSASQALTGSLTTTVNDQAEVLSCQLNSGTDSVVLGTGNAIFVAGSGLDLIDCGDYSAGGNITTSTFPAGGYPRTGVDTLTFIKGSAGGTYFVAEFNVNTDKIALSGYSGDEVANIVKNQVDAGTSTTLKLSDGSTIILGGVGVLTASSFLVESPSDIPNALDGNTAVSGMPGGQTFTSDSGNGFASTTGGTNTIDFSQEASGASDIVQSAGNDTITGGNGSLSVNATGNASITTQSAGTADITLGSGNSTIISQGSDTITGGSGNDTITATGSADISGSTGTGSYTFSGNDTFSSIGNDTVNVVGGKTTIFASGASLSANLVSGELSLTEDGSSGVGMADIKGGPASVSAGSSMSGINVILKSSGETAALGMGATNVDATQAPDATILGGTGSATITTAIGGQTTVNLAAESSGMNDTVISQGFDTITGGAGSLILTTEDSANITTSAFGTDTITLGASGNQITSQGTDTIIATANGSDSFNVSGNSIISDGSGTNQLTLSGNDTVTSIGNDVITINGGLSNVNASGSSISTTVNQGAVHLNWTDPTTANVTSISTSGGQANILLASGQIANVTLSSQNGVFSINTGNAIVDASSTSGDVINGGNSLLTVTSGDLGTINSGSGGVNVSTGSQDNTTVNLSSQAIGVTSNVVVNDNSTIIGGQGTVGISATANTASVLVKLASSETVNLNGLSGAQATIEETSSGDNTAPTTENTILNISGPEILTLVGNGYVGSASAITAQTVINTTQIELVGFSAEQLWMGLTSSGIGPTTSLNNASPLILGNASINFSSGSTPTTSSLSFLNTTAIGSPDLMDVVSGLGMTSNSTLNGTSGDDVILGSDTTSVITTGGGNDIIVAASKSETIFTGSGSSTVYLMNEASTSSDQVNALGNDTIYGNSIGIASISAGLGANVTVNAGSGSMTFINNNGQALINGGSGTLTIAGVNGSAVVNAGSGSTTFTAGSGASTFNGGSGRANIYGKAGAITVDMGSGGGTFSGGTGAVTYLGGSGSETVIAGTGTGNYTLGSGYDTFTGGSGVSVVNGGLGHATMTTGAGGGTFTTGQVGGSVIYGGTGKAFMYGTANGDQLYAEGSAGDYLQAGSGSETLSGTLSNGYDTMVAGSGSDVLIAGTGGDSLTAGTGTDIFRFINGYAGSNYVINDFIPGSDKLQLLSYGSTADANAFASQQSDLNGGTMITLMDGSHIDVIGVGTLARSSFI